MEKYYTLKGRNILIGSIVFIISFAACISLSIQSASKKAADSAKEGLSVTAQIGVDRQAMMEGMQNKEDHKVPWKQQRSYLWKN